MFKKLLNHESKIVKPRLILLVGTFVFTMGILVYLLVQQQEWVDKQNKQIIDTGKVTIAIRDNYNGIGENPSIMEFIEEKDSLKKLQRVYKELNENPQFTYVEILKQVFEYKGYCNFDPQFINDNNQEYANQLVNEEYYTPLKSLQVSSKVYDGYNLNNQIQAGSGFAKENYVIQDSMTVKVILGSNYNNLFHLGDIFHAKYLGYGDLTCEVIGFLKPEASINLDNKKILLDDYILAPAVNYIETTGINDKFQKILYSIKSTCNVELVFDNAEQYHEILKELENCFKKANIDYRYESRILELPNRIDLSKNISVVLGCFGLFVGGICLYWYCKLTPLLKVKITGERENFSFFLHLLLEIAINVFMNIFIVFVILYINNFQSIYSRGVQAIVLYSLFTFLTVIFIQKRNKYNKK